jgi:signal transduction histidine kinase/ActR/RegA family two-component response regulator
VVIHGGNMAASVDTTASPPAVSGRPAPSAAAGLFRWFLWLVAAMVVVVAGSGFLGQHLVFQQVIREEAILDTTRLANLLGDWLESQVSDPAQGDAPAAPCNDQDQCLRRFARDQLDAQVRQLIAPMMDRSEVLAVHLFDLSGSLVLNTAPQNPMSAAEAHALAQARGGQTAAVHELESTQADATPPAPLVGGPATHAADEEEARTLVQVFVPLRMHGHQVGVIWTTRDESEAYEVVNAMGWRLSVLNLGLLILGAGALGVLMRRATQLAQRHSVELVSANLQLSAARDAAEAANRAKSNFLANMSHEIRTPMTAILGFTQLLRAPGLSEADRADFIQTIDDNGKHLVAVINDILDLAKIEAQRMEIRSAPLQLTGVLGDVVQTFQVTARDKGLRLNLNIEADLPAWIVSDATRLRQILINLVGNAVKFTTQGQVHVQARRADAALCIDVIDQGIGITPDQHHLLFQPFSQIDGSMTRAFGGTGLGLVISRRLALLLNGDLTVQSTPHLGSTFTLTLPLVAAAVGAPAAPTGPPVALAPSSPGVLPHLPVPPFATESIMTTTSDQPLRILIAEDVTDNRTLLIHMLKPLNAQITAVADGEDALNRARAAWEAGPDQAFHLILMDVQMPKLDGLTATRRLRAIGCRTPILAVTAHALTDDRRRCLEAGCDDYISKPVNRDALRRLVERLTERRSAA